MRVAVTGAHGYLGAHVVAALRRGGSSVRAVVSPWGDAGRLDRFAGDPEVTTARADVRDAASLRVAFDGCDAVVHAAARVADHGPWRAFHDTNVTGTLHACRAAAGAGAGRFVLVSSLAVFRYRGFRGEDPRDLVRDADAFPYGRSKRMAEDVVLAEAPEPVIVRPALWPYGEGDPSLARVVRALRLRAFPLVDGGHARLQTVDARYLADVLARCSEHPAAPGRSYLAADDGAPRWRELLTLVARLAGAPPPWLTLPGGLVERVAGPVEDLFARLAPRREPPLTRYRAGLMRRDVVLDASAVTRELGLRPGRSRSEALREAVASVTGG